MTIKKTFSIKPAYTVFISISLISLSQIVIRYIFSGSIFQDRIFTHFSRFLTENTLLFLVTFLYLKVFIRFLKKKIKGIADISLIITLSFIVIREVINIILKSYGDPSTSFIQIESSNIPEMFFLSLGTPGLNSVTWGAKITLLLLPSASAIYFSNRGEKIIRGFIAFITTYIVLFTYLILPTTIAFLYSLPEIKELGPFELAKYLSSAKQVFGINKRTPHEFTNLTIYLPVFLLIWILISIVWINCRRSNLKSLRKYFDFSFLKKIVLSFFSHKDKLTKSIGYLIYITIFFLGFTTANQIYPRNGGIDKLSFLILSNIVILILISGSIQKRKTAKIINILGLLIIANAYLIEMKIALLFTFIIGVNLLRLRIRQVLKDKRHLQLNSIFYSLSIISIFTIGYILLAQDQSTELIPKHLLILVLTTSFFYHTFLDFHLKEKHIEFKILNKNFSILTSTLKAILIFTSLILPVLLFDNILILLLSPCLAILNFLNISNHKRESLQKIIIASVSLLLIYLFLVYLILDGSIRF